MTLFSVPDMSCGHCRTSVDKAIRLVDAAATLTFDMAARRVEITSTADNAVLQSALKDAGFAAVPL